MTRPLRELFAIARVVLWRKLSRLILGPLVGRMPYTSIRSVLEQLYRDQIKKHVVDIFAMYEPLIVKYDFPKAYPLYFCRDKTFEKRFVYILKDVCVSPRSGLVWLQEGYILEESVGSFRRIAMGWDGVLHEPMRATKALNLEKPIVSCPPTGYFHWLFERMPPILHAAKIVPDVLILVPKRSPKYVLDALKLLLGSEEYRERVIVSQSPVRVSSIIMPQAEVYSGFVHPGDIERLRSDFKSKTNTTGQAGNRLVYVSRRYTPTRPLTNEKELEEGLCMVGFSIVHCEDMATV